MKFDFNNINPGLKVGSNCFYMNVSSILESKRMLSMALSFSNFDFIYNQDYYMKFINPRPAKDYISKDNDLLIVGSVDSHYHNAYNTYLNNFERSFSLFDVSKMSSDIRVNLKEIKKQLLDKGVPLITSCDHYYLYDEYSRNTNDIMHYHSGAHASTIFDFDETNNKCYIVDKFFSFKGYISAENFLNGVTSAHISEPFCCSIELNKVNELTEAERIKYLLKRNIDNSLIEKIEIDGITYLKNLKALEVFIENYENHLQDIIEQKGKYAPQFNTKLLSPVRLNKSGFSNLMTYLNQNFDNSILKDLEYLLKETVELWSIMDKLCDRCYLHNHKIIDYKDRLLKILVNIYENEKCIFDKMSKVNEQL